MNAVENDAEFALRYPDLENYTDEQKAYYDAHWHEVGDIHEWGSDGLSR